MSKDYSQETLTWKGSICRKIRKCSDSGMRSIAFGRQGLGCLQTWALWIQQVYCLLAPTSREERSRGRSKDSNVEEKCLVRRVQVRS